MNKHRWSGWPGAYCWNCGESDPAEECVALGCYIRETEGPNAGMPKESCEKHKETECKYPGQYDKWLAEQKEKKV